MDSPRTSIRDRLAERHILLTGSTGFLAKAILEKLLRSVPTLGGIHLLVRPKSDGTSGRDRVAREVLGNRVFDRLRASLGDRFAELCEEKVHVVEGDLTKQRLGLDPQVYANLVERISVVVNSAATVTFDERIDWAIELNALGPSRLLDFAKACGDVPFLHVSTCYVCGIRQGEIIEDFTAPEPARESLPKCSDGKVDLDGLIESMRDQTRELIKQHEGDGETLRRALIDAGMSRARSFGWNDTYTFTKWMGEQLLLRDRGSVPLVVFRPAIIEGSLDEPIPGWIDGLRMADPIITAYGRGKLTRFPGRQDVPIDLIPVDLVANGIIAAIPVEGATRRDVAVMQSASSGRRPLRVGQLVALLEEAFDQQPMTDDRGRTIRPQPMRLVGTDQFVRQWRSTLKRLTRYRRFLERVRPSSKKLRKITALSRQIEQLLYFAKIYAPYTNLDCRFVDDELRQVWDALSEEDRAEFPFAVDEIDWADYLINRHIPGLRTFVLGASGAPSARIRALSTEPSETPTATEHTLQADNLFDVFARSAERFTDKPALQMRIGGRWVRYTYGEALRATGTIMRRLQERGLRQGDRIALCANNGPAWGLTYFAAMRAGLTVVPLDPQLPPDEVWSCVRFAGANLLCAGSELFPALSESASREGMDTVSMSEPFVPPPGASRDPAPPPNPAPGHATASILFTSGTTLGAKAVPLTHHNLIANARGLTRVHPIFPSDEFLSILPMYHAFEFMGGFLVPLACGATITYVKELKGPEILGAMQATGTTMMMIVPRLLHRFLDSIEEQVATAGWPTRCAFGVLRFASWVTGGRYARWIFRNVHQQFGGRLRMFVSGGSHLGAGVWEGFRRLGFTIHEGYGLTETSPVLTVTPTGGARAGSVGPPLPNVDLEIRNQNQDSVGEIWVRGPSVMSGYLNNPDATAEAIQDGWFRTGDLGREEADGSLVLTGRTKDLIITGAGKNVYPDEVEVRYADLPFTKELCIFGMASDDGLGDAVHAVIVTDEAGSPELDRSSIERQIRAAVASISETVPMHQRITRLHFWEHELPKTSTLKAKRALIREIVEQAATPGADDHGGAVKATRGSDQCPPSTRPAQAHRDGQGRRFAAGRDRDTSGDQCNDKGQPSRAWSTLQEILAKPARRTASEIEPEMNLLLDLGIDSISKIDVLATVESRFGIEIEDAVGAQIARVSDLVKVVSDLVPSQETEFSAAGRPSDAGWKRRFAGNGSVPGGSDRHAPGLSPMRWMVRGVGGAFMHSYVRVRACGVENIPEKGAFILAPNHASHLDAPAILTAIGGRRRVWVAAAEDYFFNTRLRRFLFAHFLDVVSFDRAASGVEGLQRCGRVLGDGDGLLLFPEGTRSRTGRMQPFKTGAAVLAIERQVPILPVHVHRSFQLLRKGRLFPRPGTIIVSFGQPRHPPLPEEGEDRYDAFQVLTRRIESDVRTLRRQAKTL